MTPYFRQVYFDQRKWFTAINAYKNAQVMEAFKSLRRNGWVRLKVEHDVQYDASWMDDVYDGHTVTKELQRIEDQGTWGLIAEYYDDLQKDWVICDATWGFIGNDWENSGYDFDLMCSAINHYVDAQVQLTKCGMNTVH